MCGILGITDSDGRAAAQAVLGLATMQNRGPQGAGIGLYDSRGELQVVRGAGSVEAVFDGIAGIGNLPGSIAVGQTRYATVGETIQPLIWDQWGTPAALTHNGELANANQLRERAEKEWGYRFESTSDTELIIPFLKHAPEGDFADALVAVLQREVRGAFNLVILFKDKLYCVRDPNGFHPLVFGANERMHVAASESVAFDALGVQYVCDIGPGELAVIGHAGIERVIQWAKPTRSSCIFEFVYFANPPSYVEQVNVSRARDMMGRIQFESSGWLDVDVVVPILDSGLHAALGYYAALQKYAVENGKFVPELKAAVHRSWFVGRSFLQSEQAVREMIQRVKSNVIKFWVDGKRVLVIDDSLVRGTVMRTIVQFIRAAGAREVHVRIPSPPIMAPCPYGIDTYEDELIAARMHGDVERIRRFINADSLGYLSPEHLLRSVVEAQEFPVRGEADFCTACFTGHYPVAFEQDRRSRGKAV